MMPSPMNVEFVLQPVVSMHQFISVALIDEAEGLKVLRFFCNLLRMTVLIPFSR